MVEETKAPGGLEASLKTMDPAAKGSGAQTTKGSSANHTVDDSKASIEKYAETIVDISTDHAVDNLKASTEQGAGISIHEPAKVPTPEQVKDSPVDEVKEAPGNEVKDSALDEVNEHPSDEGKKPGTVAENADKPLKNGDSTGAKSSSDKVLEGQKWNNRDRAKRDFRKNVKSDLTSQEESSDPVAIRKQVEFYFSNSNLLQDQFLYSKVEGHLNLPVPISIIASFQRMRHFKPHSAIIAALKESKILNVVENDSCVQRKEALPENFKDKPMNEIIQVHEDEAMSRSLYAKGFGEEKPSTQFDIEAFFAEHGSTNSVRLRRTFDRTFKGSAFVEFDSEETQQAFLALDPKPKWKGSELLIKSKKQYCEEKVEEIKNGRVKPNAQWRPYYDNKSKSGDQRGKEGDRDWRDRRNEDQKGGFQDKRGGGRKGFGSSGRGGRGGGRGGARGGGRGGRDNQDKFDKRRNGRNEHQVPKIATTSAAADDPPTASDLLKLAQAPAQTTELGIAVPIEKAQTAPQAAASTSATEVPTKKRTREADDGDEPQPNTKKVDVKAGES